MRIKIDLLSDGDARSLYEFELENRLFFEEMVPSRGEEYYKFETFKMKLKDLLDEQANGLSYFYLIKNDDDTILGRMNLVDLDYAESLGHIGYRVGKAYTGQGIANQALLLLLDVATKMGLKQLVAKTTTNNIPSQRVMEKNGFTCMGTSDEVFKMNGKDLSFVHYKWTHNKA